ncbi:MAG: hypothetical protein GEV06_10535 [Luteitalea sp.]|nr:hypothetical protein [Luteitalea sp.]
MPEDSSRGMNPRRCGDAMSSDLSRCRVNLVQQVEPATPAARRQAVLLNEGPEGPSRWVIERNHLYGVPEHAIHAHRLYGTSISDNYIEGFGETAQGGIWYGIEATIQGDKASTIANNKVFTGDEDNGGSIYRYIGISGVNYNHGVVSVTGNAVRGAGTPRGFGLYYSQGGGDGLTVASSGNIITDIGSALATEGDDVMVTPVI